MVIPPVGPTCVVCFRICYSESLVYRLTLGIHRTRESACWLVSSAPRPAKRNRTDDTNASTLILQPGIPQGAPLGPLAAYSTTPTQASGAAALAPAPTHAPVPIAAPAIPHAPVPIAIPHAPNPYVPNTYGSGGDPNAEVRISATVWGKDHSLFKALLSLMPHGQHITRNVRARRIPGQRNYLAMTFPNTLDAAASVQAWAAGPAPGYHGVTAVLGN
ncbi:hypothetical protein LshimejAT787_1901680 [Lyophyllum shimeji]|uniref:Uncharacterized protein n=1 Tax=Lyophyllum shimeji TaxID=47721 RepID=A0A9P3UTM2_LYOSH|nr:hypothetical protein LshimejAT787_1103110 [Lyophyllum shimeji]GLB45090.1 hypothetical protein LshimejAT787_1901680 [Lyophyllum shimeji]